MLSISHMKNGSHIHCFCECARQTATAFKIYRLNMNVCKEMFWHNFSLNAILDYRVWQSNVSVRFTDHPYIQSNLFPNKATILTTEIYLLSIG